uniref:Uncharacterized protein n=1 Tax=Leersia perrieri TaxID=77586 RepID=A0A0D9VRR0_9ORYZ
MKDWIIGSSRDEGKRRRPFTTHLSIHLERVSLHLHTRTTQIGRDRGFFFFVVFPNRIEKVLEGSREGR